MPDEIEKLFVTAFLSFLKKQIQKQNADAAESIEVAIQCLEAAYEISSESAKSAPSDEQGGECSGSSCSDALEEIDLFELFESAAVNVTPDRKTKAEEIKNEGNRLMKEAKYSEALQQYTRAISMDATNPVFYCNRAAAYIRLNEFDKAITECKMSLLYNPKYSKAHGRMGIAYSNLEKFEAACEAYKRALQLEPGNVDYQNNLRLCEERLQQSNQNMGQDFLQGFEPDNDSYRNLISEMLQDPMVSAASRQILAQMVNEYPEVISGFRQQLLNLTSGTNLGSLVNLQQQQNNSEELPGPSSRCSIATGGDVRQDQNTQTENQANVQNHENIQQNNINDSNPVRGAISQEEINIGHIQQREGNIPADSVRRPLHLRQPPPRPGPDAIIQQMALAAGAAPHFEELPPSDGPNIRGLPAHQVHSPRSDGGGDEQNE